MVNNKVGIEDDLKAIVDVEFLMFYRESVEQNFMVSFPLLFYDCGFVDSVRLLALNMET
jgi:hypothetical protein